MPMMTMQKTRKPFAVKADGFLVFAQIKLLFVLRFSGVLRKERFYP